VATTSVDGRILLCQARFGQAFSGWRPIAGNGRTDAPVSLACIENTLFVFCKGLDGRIYVNQAELTSGNASPEIFAKSFSGWFEIPGVARRMPRLPLWVWGKAFWCSLKGWMARFS